jgi:hypothetical protein
MVQVGSKKKRGFNFNFKLNNETLFKFAKSAEG